MVSNCIFVCYYNLKMNFKSIILMFRVFFFRVFKYVTLLAESFHFNISTANFKLTYKFNHTLQGVGRFVLMIPVIRIQ